MRGLSFWKRSEMMTKVLTSISLQLKRSMICLFYEKLISSLTYLGRCFMSMKNVLALESTQFWFNVAVHTINGGSSWCVSSPCACKRDLTYKSIVNFHQLLPTWSEKGDNIPHPHQLPGKKESRPHLQNNSISFSNIFLKLNIREGITSTSDLSLRP